MSFQLAGQVVGSFFGPFGSLVGGMIGGAIDGAIAGDKGSGADLSAPGLQLGRQLPRVYGRVRLPCNPIWASEFREHEHSSGGKGAPSGPSSYTYSLDMLCAICDGSNVIAVTRIWVNKKLVYTSLAESSDASVVWSQSAYFSSGGGGFIGAGIRRIFGIGPSQWDSFELLTGGPSQVPWSTYEDAVGAANAPAYRNLCTIGFADLQCGGGKTPPAVEVEVITAGTDGAFEVDALVKLQAQFATDASDESAYNHTPTVTGSPTYGGVFQTDLADGNMKAAWGSTDLARASADDAWTMQADFIATNLATTSSWVNNLVCGYGWTEAATSPYFRIELLNNVGTPSVSASFAGTRVGITPILLDQAYRAAIRYVPGVSPLVQFIFNGAVVYEADATLYGDFVSTPATNGAVDIGRSDDPFNEARQFSVDSVRLKNAVVDISELVATGELPPPDGIGEYTTWTPLPVTLDDIISDELQLNPEVPSTDFDVTDLASIEVIGYTAAGSQTRTVQELCEVHYVDVVPGNPIRLQRRGTTSVSTIQFVDTGVGVDDTSNPFAGLKRGNADERPAVAALRFPLIDRDHEAGYERGDRLSTDSDDVRTIETRVVMGAEKAKGRAITATLLDKVRSHTAQFALSDKYAKAEPGDVYTPEDNDGNSYRARILRFSYADGVKNCDWELDDTTALVETGMTDTNYTPSVEIATPGEAEVLPLDIPLQRVQDDNPGYLAAVKCSDESRVYYLESPSDTTYTEVAQFQLDAVFGTISSITGTPSIVATDTGCSITVDVGDGTLSSITDATLLLDNTANRFVIGAYGREVIGQFRDCTLSAPGVYVLSGFLWGLNGTAQYVDDIAAVDHFCLLNENGGVKHIGRTSAQLGVEHHIKVVPERRSQASIDGEAFTNSGVALKPLVGINPHAERDAGTGDITLTWDRQTRYPTRFGGDLGDSTPLGEESEHYQVRLYTDNTFATLLREFDVVTTTEVVYTSAQRTTDSHTPITAALYVDVRQISATVGEGYALQATL
jgi:hypothetical protein